MNPNDIVNNIIGKKKKTIKQMLWGTIYKD